MRWRWWATASSFIWLTARGHGSSKYEPLVLEGKPLKSEPWAWLWGEINPQRLVADQTVEGVRNAENGWWWAWDAHHNDAAS